MIIMFVAAIHFLKSGKQKISVIKQHQYLDCKYSIRLSAGFNIYSKNSTMVERARTEWKTIQIRAQRDKVILLFFMAVETSIKLSDL